MPNQYSHLAPDHGHGPPDDHGPPDGHGPPGTIGNPNEPREPAWGNVIGGIWDRLTNPLPR